MTSRRTGGAGGGFTLLELLIVIAVIAVLTAILAPALSRVKGTAKLVICRTRLHNTGRALVQNAMENHRRFPVSDYVDSRHRGVIDALIASAGSVNPEDFYCPDETEPSRMHTPENYQEGRIGYFYYSCKWPTYNVDISGFLRYTVPWPRELTREMSPDTWILSDSWFRGQPTPHTGFSKGVNFLTINGDVDMVESSPSNSFK